MKKIGLALSGGGFRASLYHLGLVRFLRDAGILPNVSHITSVSGGSIIAAHLVLNWDRYNGSPNEFDAAASELLSFVRLDVRNRITRRFPLTFPLLGPRWLLGCSNRKLRRTGLLEWHYEKYLYGDTSLFELPAKPQLHLLATNLSEGCLCSFNRNGLLMVRRQPGHTFRLDRIHIGLGTVAMAVTASSAFPGFFPPLELTGADVGANVGEFGRQAYTDGGVFDNLGVRMFGCLERSLLAEGPLARDDFVDFQAVGEALQQANKSSEETPLKRLAQVLVVACSRPELLPLPSVGAVSKVLPPPTSGIGDGDNSELMLSKLWHVLRHYQFQLDPLFIGMKPVEADAEVLLQFSRIGGKALDPADQLWLNRHLLEAAFRQATGQACFRRLNSGLDGVLVSDVGKRIEVQGDRRAGGLIRTALRATDILMDRVWQLENETFRDTPGFTFAPITEVIEPDADPTALHPEIQRQVANIRTDLDRFSPLEISSLIRHGYCVGRKACRVRPELFGTELPDNAPWDPIPGPCGEAPLDPVATCLNGPSNEPTAPTVGARTLQAWARRRIWSTVLDFLKSRRARPDPFGADLPSNIPVDPPTGPPGAAPPVPVARRQDGPSREPTPTTVEARALQASALRRIWSTLLDYRDWTSYVYVPLLVPLLLLMPYFIVESYQRSHRTNQLIESFAQGSPDLKHMSRLLDNGPEEGWTGVAAEDVSQIEKPNREAFEILQSSVITDLRNWQAGATSDSSSLIHRYHRLKVLRKSDDAGSYLFHFPVGLRDPKAQFRFPPQQLEPKLRKSSEVESSSRPGEKECDWDVSYDFRKAPVGDSVDLVVEFQYSGRFGKHNETGNIIPFTVPAETAELTMWILMPRGKQYRDFRILRRPTGTPDRVVVQPASRYLAEDSTILAFRMLSVKPGYGFEVQWFYK